MAIKALRKDKVSLSPRHAAFVSHYIATFSATKAATAAGFSKRSAAYVLLRKHEIAAEISARRHALAENMENITNARLEYELASVGLASMADFAPMFGDGDVPEKLANLTRTQAAAVKEIIVEDFKDGRSDFRTVRRTKFKLHDKAPSLRLLAEVRGMVTEKVDVKHTHTGTILHATLEEIAAEEDGKPIVDVTPNNIDDKGQTDCLGLGSGAITGLPILEAFQRFLRWSRKRR